MKIIGYVRESTMGQVLYGYNLDDQRKRIEYFVKANYPGSELEFLIDAGCSAKDLNRREMINLIKIIKEKGVDIVVIQAYDRLVRSVKDMVYLTELFKSANVELVSESQNFDTGTPHGRYIRYVISANAELEREYTMERTLRGIQEAAKQGYYPIKAPYGYTKVDRKLVVNPEEALIIIDAFKKIANNQYSIRQLQVYLRFSYPEGRWYKNKLTRMLNNKIYIGVFNKYDLYIENHSPIIIDMELWKQSRLSQNVRKKIVKHRYMYHHKIICDKCDVMCVQKPTIKPNKTYIYYVCPNCKKRIEECKITEKIWSTLSLGVLKSQEEKMKKKYSDQLRKIMALYKNDILVCEGKGFDYKKSLSKAIELNENYLKAKSEIIKRFSKMDVVEFRSIILRGIRNIRVNYSTKKMIVIEVDATND